MINKSDSRCAVVRFCYHSYDYRPNWTPLGPITITNILVTAGGGGGGWYCSSIIAPFSFFDQFKLLPMLITLLCLGLQTMYPSVQATIWGNVGKVTELLDTVLDCFIKVYFVMNVYPFFFCFLTFCTHSEEFCEALHV